MTTTTGATLAPAAPSQALAEQHPEHFDPPFERCGACGSADIQLWYRDWRGNDIWRCSDCAVQFQNPQYSAAYLNDYYGNYVKGKKDNPAAFYASHRYKVELLNRFTSAAASDRGRLLDVGCGKGFMLRAAADTGWTPEGYDVDADTTRMISGQTGIAIRTGDFTAIDWPEQHYDAIVLSHVIEHLKSPHAYLDVFERVLKPGGLLLVAAPNIGSFAARLKQWMERSGLRKKGVGDYYDTDHHLWYYTPTSLRRLLESRGYEVLYTRADRGARKLKTPRKRLIKRLLGFTETTILGSTFLVICRKRSQA